MRSIIVLRRLATRADAPTTADVLSEDRLQRTPGTTLSAKPPVPVPSISAEEIAARPSDQLPVPRDGLAIEAEFDDEDAQRRFVQANADVVVGVYTNPAIVHYATVCPMDPVGDTAGVKSQMRFGFLHAGNHKGQAVRIAIVDTGVNDLIVPVAGGLALPRFAKPGSAPSGHGTMVAFDARLAASAATFLDYPLLAPVSPADDEALLFDALAVFDALLNDFKNEQSPMVVVNSWGIANRSHDRAGELAQPYSSNPQHIFNLSVATLVAEGADVLFAAGNCGGPCPLPRCAPEHIGAGKGILGANSHSDVITIGAVTVRGDLLGYSSQGPGSIAMEKPDLMASSHFSGSHAGAEPIDHGTSAACGVAAGIVAALRSKASARQRPPRRIKEILLATAKQPNGTPVGWNPQTGHGIIDAEAAASPL